MTRTPLLKITKLACQRGDKQLFQDVSFSVEPQQCWHVIGANGSGKTSLLRQIAGLVDSYPIDSEHAQTTPITWPHGRAPNTFAYLGHTDGLKPELTALENLSFYAHYLQVDTTLDLDQCLFDVGLLSCAELAVKHMSFGQRRRLSLARVLLAKAQLWLLDEPLTGVDVQGRELFMNLFVQHLQSDGAILLTHHQALEHSSLGPYLHRTKASCMSTFTLFFAREWQLLWRNSSVIGQPLCLFVLIALLFPFSVPPAALGSDGALSTLGSSIIWVAVLLAIMLSLESLFKDDLRDGLIEQWIIGHRSLAIAALAKVTAHWCTTGFALILTSPIVAGAYNVPLSQYGVLMLTLLIGTPSLLLIGAIGAALTVTLERSGLLITVVTLPLTIPVLIFGASALGNSAQGFVIATELYALAAIAVLALTLAPLAIAAALRLTVE